MIKYLKLLTTILLLFPLWGQGGYLFAQNYPVQCTPILTPPYTLSWVEYGSSPERLKVQLLLKDLTKPSVEVSLRIRLKGIGVVIENTPDFYTSSPITLLPGVPLMLSGAMLRENFMFENLTAQGVDLETLYAGLSLPGGFYTWEITAFLSDQRQVSNVGMAMMTVFKNNPPQITFPQNNAVLMNTGFQSINFTWMPRHRYSTNAAAGTIYTFKIYEIPTEENAGDASQETDPNVIVNSGVLPLFSTQTFGTNYLYKPSDPALVPGRRYVIQVQAGDINGLDEFENNGLSEVSTFSFGSPNEFPAPKLCKKPSNFLAEKLDEQSVQLTWQETNSETPIDYLVSYKTENEGIWTERIVSDPSLLLIQLTPNKYQFKVSARCTYDNKSAFSNEMSVILETPKPEETPEVEPQDTYVNTDEPLTPPTVYEPEPEPEPAIDPLNTPLRIILDPSENPSLPDTLKLPKGYENLGSLPVLSDKPTTEQLKEALKSSKIDCASYLAGYSCGEHDAPAVPSGDIIQVKTGDEIAINSVGFEVVDLDGSGNGKGIVKVSMFNNAKFGVEFKGIKVAKGGCVVAGEAVLSNVDVAILSEEQRKKLAETYATFNKVLAIVDSLAPEIAETYNSVSDFVQKFKQGLSNYVGGVKDAVVMKKQFKAAEKYADLLLKNKNLSDSTRNGLKAAYDEAMATKDFFCSGKECQEGKANPKKGGPFGEFDYIVSLCEENKAKVLKLQDYLLKGEKESSQKIYDFEKKEIVEEYVSKDGETTNNEVVLSKNECGEYLMLLQTTSLGSPSLGIPSSSTLVPPKGKKPASSQFSEIELYQYVLLREMYSDIIDCKTIAFTSDYYIDSKYNSAKHFVRAFLTEENFMGSSTKVNNEIRDNIIIGLFGNKEADAVKAIKTYSNFNATFNAHTILDFARKYAIAEVGGRIVLGAFAKIVNQPLIKSLVGKVLARFLPNVEKGITLDATKLGMDNSTLSAAKWMKPEEGWFDVVIHGTPDNFKVFVGDRWVTLSHRDLVNYLKSIGYKPRTPIRLVSCNTGVFPDAIGKDLANKIGANVKAPKGLITVYESGKYTISGPTGEWRIFEVNK
jgi:hypothetical protein